MSEEYPYVGVARSVYEEGWYCEFHGCPQCSSREGQRRMTLSGRMKLEDRWIEDAHYFAVTCFACGHVRRYLFEFDRESDKRLMAQIRECYYAAGFANELVFDGVPPEVSRVKFQLGPEGECSHMVEPHDFASELVRIAAQYPADRRTVNWSAFRQAIVDLRRALTCAYELRKFLAAGEDVIADRHVTTGQGQSARAVHPACFTRAWIDAQVEFWERAHAARDAEEQERAALPETDPRGRDFEPPPKLSLFQPLSRVSVRVHELWLEKKPDGERLVATTVDATGAKLSTRNLSSCVLTDVTLDRADLSFGKLHGAELIRVRAREASFASVLMAGAAVIDCDFEDAELALVKLGDAMIAGTSFRSAHLDRSTWYRATVTRCNFASATFTNAGIDHARFTDCDFRGASFAVPREILGTATDAVFERCDLRDTDWAGLDLFRTRFIDCKLGGSQGVPAFSETVVERADLSPAGDGSTIGGLAEWMTLLGAEVETVAEPPVEPPAAAPEWPPARPAGPSRGRRAEQIIDAQADRDASFEDTLHALVASGLTREQALEAIVDPYSLDR